MLTEAEIQNLRGKVRATQVRAGQILATYIPPVPDWTLAKLYPRIQFVVIRTVIFKSTGLRPRMNGLGRLANR